VADIFLSCNREDQARARAFVEAFEAQGFSVWWDVGLRTGEAYDEVTETSLRTAKAVVVLWSKKRSVQSRWVRAEVQEAMRKTHKVAPGEGLDFWISLARNSNFSEADRLSYSKHFIDAWNATPQGDV